MFARFYNWLYPEKTEDFIRRLLMVSVGGALLLEVVRYIVLYLI